MKKIISLLTLFLLTHAVWAQPVDSLYFATSEPGSGTLRDYLEAGLANNYDIRIVYNREQIADNNATRGNAGFYPSVDISAGYSGAVNNTRQELTDGTVNKSGSVHNRSASAGLNTMWMLFEGFSVQTSYKRLKELQQMGELNTRLQIENFISRFTAEYYNYIRQTIRLKNLLYAVSLSERRVNIVKDRVSVGAAAVMDLEQAKVDMNSDKSALLKQYETLHTIRTNLNEMLGSRSIEEFHHASDTITFDTGLDRDALWLTTLSENVYLKIARKEGDISRLDLKAVQSRNYPYLRLNAGYGYSGNWYDTGSFEHQRTLGLNYGLTAGFSIFNGSAQRRQQRNARIEIENRELEYEQTELGLSVDMSNAWMAYENNMKLVQLEKDNLETARKYYEIADYRYLLGQLSGLELREAQTSLLAAEERMTQALYDTKLCEISLFQIAGMIVTYLQ